MISPLRLPNMVVPADYRAVLRQNSLPYLAVTFPVLAAFAWYRSLFPIPVFPLDNAYIVIHNAQVLLAGGDPSYSGASPLSGTTSLVHLALVSGLMFFFSPLAALSASLWIAVLLYALGLVRLARVNGACRLTSVLVALAGLIAGKAPHQLMNGLETGMALAAVTWTLALLSGPQRPPSRLLPALCGTLPFIRPDLLPLTVLFLSLQIARQWRIRRGLPDLLYRASRDTAIACLFALPWALWSWSEEGSVFPSTINAKRFFFAQAGWPADFKADLVVNGLSQFGSDLGILAVFALFLVATWLGRAGFAFAGALLLAYYAGFPGALGIYGGRYLYPLLPFVLLGAVYALRQPRPTLRIASAFVFALSLGQSLVIAPISWERNMNDCRFTVQELDGVAVWCSQNLPANSTLLIHDAGYISCKTRFPLVDLVGLKTPSSIAIHRRLTYPSGGSKRGQAMSEIALRSHANYLLALDDWNRDFSIISSLKAAGWQLRLVNADYAYKVYALRPPGSAATARSMSSRVL